MTSQEMDVERAGLIQMAPAPWAAVLGALLAGGTPQGRIKKMSSLNQNEPSLGDSGLCQPKAAPVNRFTAETPGPHRTAVPRAQRLVAGPLGPSSPEQAIMVISPSIRNQDPEPERRWQRAAASSITPLEGHPSSQRRA